MQMIFLFIANKEMDVRLHQGPERPIFDLDVTAQTHQFW